MRKVWLGGIAVAIACGVVWWLRRETPPDAVEVATGSAAEPVASARPVARAAGRHIAGVVVDEAGAPVRGATVKVASATRAEASAVTDAAGAFDVGAQPVAPYVVVAGAPRLTSALASVDLREPMGPPPDQLRLVLHACDASIHGTIRDVAGGTIGGAVVAHAKDGLVTTIGAIADANGAYELCVPLGGAEVAVRADGYATEHESVLVYGRTRRDFVLSPGAAVVGRVVRAGDRAPVADAVVSLNSIMVAADDAGRFRFDGIAPGRYAVAATADHLATTTPATAIAEVGRAPEEVVVEVAPAFEISGKVVVHGTSTPVAGAQVIAIARDRRRYARGVSRVDGSFTLEHVLAAEYETSVQSQPRHQVVKIESADASDVVLEVDGTASISGRVLRDGKPVDGAIVRSDAIETSSDAAGRYTLRNLPDGPHELYAESLRLGAFTKDNRVTVATGEQRTGFDLELGLAGSIAGVVVDQSDAPVAGAFLRFSLLGGRDFGNTTTADDGSFLVRGLSGGGSYLFEIRQREASALVFPPVAGKRHAPVAVRDGATHVTGLRVKVRVERLVIAGRVVDGDGKPVADANVGASDRDRGWIAPTRTDEGGAFTLRDVPAGKYDIHASATRGDARGEDIAAGRRDVVLRVQAFGGIDGTLAGFATPPAEAMAYNSRSVPVRAPITGGAFHFDGLSAGEYVVSAGDAREKVTVKPGATAQVSLRERQHGAIVGTVVDAKSRAPVADARCIAVAGDDMTFASASTDERGAFRMARVAAGAVRIDCFGRSTEGSGELTLATDDTARVEIAVVPEGYAGFTYERQLDEEIVDHVDPGGPAARAGIAVGDVLVNGAGLERPPGTVVKLTFERDDKEFEVSLTLEATP